jgi:hypothetical protein
LVLAAGSDVAFDHPIKKVISVGKTLIVLLAVPLAVLDNANEMKRPPPEPQYLEGLHILSGS